MLKPIDIREKTFEQSVLGGYRRADVDIFMQQMESDYQTLYNENNNLAQKLKLCVGKIEEYKNDEKFLKDAILNAQKLNEVALKDAQLKEKEVELTAKQQAQRIISEAQDKAMAIICDAEKTAEEMISKAKNDIIDLRDDIKQETAVENKKLEFLKKEVSDFKTKVMGIYKAHLNSISKLPEYQQPDPKNPPDEQEKAEKEQPIQPKSTIISFKKDESLQSDTQIKLETEPTPKAPSQLEIKEKTEEFVLQKTTNEKQKQTESSASKKFKDLKFGVDFDVNSDK